MKRYIVDKNYFESDKLETFFSASRHNIALITDFAAMESYSGNPLENIQRSIKILSKYSDQVKILHSTRYVVRSKPRFGSKKHWIDERSTSEFQLFCRQVEESKYGNKRSADAINGHGIAANAFLEEMLGKYTGLTHVLEKAQKRFIRSDLKKFVDNGELTESMRSGIINMTLMLTGLFYLKHPENPKMPNGSVIRETFLFRYSLVAVAQFLMLCRDGVNLGMAQKTLRNDSIDGNYIAYATLFDGILTEERKVRTAYKMVTGMLENIFS